MKNALLIAAILCLSPVFSKEKIFTEPRQIVSLFDLDIEIVKEMSSGSLPDTVIECKAGSVIPLAWIHNSGVFSFASRPNLSIKIEEDCYFRFLGKKLYMSQDLVTWEKAKKKLLDLRPPKVEFIISEQAGLLVETSGDIWSDHGEE
jgi:hypothetical protein